MTVNVVHSTLADSSFSEEGAAAWDASHTVTGLATVASTGAYSDLSGTPTLGTAASANTTDFATAAQGAKADTAVQPGVLATVATTGSYTNLVDTPTLGTAAAANTTDFATAAQGTKADTAVQPNTSTTLTSLALTSGTISSTPANSNDIVNKVYVDSVATEGTHYHQPVLVETPSALNVTYNNGSSGVGATLTNAGAQATLVIDSVTVAVNDRVLVYKQTNQAQNGVYVVTNVGSGSTNWVLTRASDANTYDPYSPNALGKGDAFYIQSGNTGAGETYVCNTVGTIVFGTTDITFAQISSAQIYSAGTGLNLVNLTFSIADTGTAGTYGSATLIPVITTNAQGQITSVTTAANPQGTVTNVSGTAPVSSSGGTTPTISMTKATGSVDGYLSSIDWNTFNSKGNGTVTSVAALTLGTSGSDLSSTVANGTTTPVITLNVPTASSTNRGALSSTDWSTFNGKQAALVSGTNIKTVNGSTLLGSGDLTVIGALAESTSVFTSGSAQTYTAPANTQWVKVTVVGPGGNGGAATNQRATGGGGGAVAIKWLAMNAGQTLTYTVGTASGTASTVASGTLSITTISAGSGANGAGTAYAASITAGAAGGTATGGDVNITGGKGGYSYGSGTTVTTNFGGKGGDCPGFGSGGPALALVATAGQVGTGYGAGGGGAHGNNTAANGTGGIIIFEAY